MSEMRLWGGRFAGEPAPELDRINRSLPVDWRLWPYELAVDRAWVAELVEIGVIPDADGRLLLDGLDSVRGRLESGAPGEEPDEDIHTLVERWLADEVGDRASQVRLGRSRNDVVATDTRLWTLDACDRVDEAVRGLQVALTDAAEAGVEIPWPAYTHLQRAQPIVAAHWLLSHFWPLQRGRERLREARARVALLPLGAAAGAGSTLPVDRERLAKRLGTGPPCANSLDAVGARDWAAEVLFVWTQSAVDLSRLAEDLIVYASAEFGLVEIDDAYSTGSSLMPHKRNPDGAELARARAGTSIGALAGYLATLKGLPSGYNKDLQEDKRTLFAAEEALTETLSLLAGTVRTLRFDGDRAVRSISPDMLAADVAERLAAEGVPFRVAHEAVGRLLREAAEVGRAVAEISPDAAGAIDPCLQRVGRAWWDVSSALDRRVTDGAGSPRAARRQLEAARSVLRED